MRVYHGSPIVGLKLIEPRISTHGVPYVYATKKREIAITFLAKWNDFLLNLSTNTINGIEKIQITERYKNALFDIYKNKSGYIYTLDGTKFEEGKTSYTEEVVADEVVQVIECQQIIDIYDELCELERKGKLQLFIFPDKPEYIPYDDSDLIKKAIYFYKNSGDTGMIDYCAERHPHLKNELNKIYKEIN